MAYTIQMNLDEAAHALRRTRLDYCGYFSFVISLVLCIVISITARKNTFSSPVEFRLWTAYPLDRQWGSYLTILLATTYTALLVTFSFRGTGTDFLHLTKALGEVAVAQFPALMILGSKAPALTFAGGYERINVWHRWLARTIAICLAGHAGLYMYFFNVTHRWFRFWMWDILSGAVALLAMGIMAGLYFEPIRVRWYRAFYIAHIIFASIVFPLMYFHVRHTRPYALLSFLLVVLDRYFLRETSNSNLKISLPAPTLVHLALTRAQPWPTHIPGQHMQLSIPELSSWGKLPLTIASVEGTTAHFFARVRDGFTAKLAEKAGSEFKCYAEGPYGGIMRKPKNTLAIVGGVGITFGAGFLGTGADVTWIVRGLDEARAVPGEGRVYITGEGQEDVDSVGGWTIAGKDRPDLRRVIEEWMKEKEAGADEVIGLAVCGPWGLAEEVRSEAERLIGSGRRVWFWREEFGW